MCRPPCATWTQHNKPLIVCFVLLLLFLTNCVFLFTRKNEAPQYVLINQREQIPVNSNESTSCCLQLQAPLPDNGIYFLETSDLPFLTPKQLCAVESAALHHANITVVAAVTSPYLLKTRAIERLLAVYPNIVFAKALLSELLQGTPLSSWMESGALGESEFKVGHTSDVLRAALLYKHGGIYLDLDIIVLRNLTMPKNSVPRSYLVGVLANGVLAFERGHAVLKEHMDEIAAHYDGANWDRNGPKMLTDVVRRRCDGGKLPNDVSRSAFCKDVHVLPSVKFYPLPSARWPDLFNDDFQVAGEILRGLNDTILVHYWNHYSEKSTIYADSQQALGVLAREHCPVVSASHAGELWGRL